MTNLELRIRRQITGVLISFSTVAIKALSPNGMVPVPDNVHYMSDHPSRGRIT